MNFTRFPPKGGVVVVGLATTLLFSGETRRHCSGRRQSPILAGALYGPNACGYYADESNRRTQWVHYGHRGNRNYYRVIIISDSKVEPVIAIVVIGGRACLRSGWRWWGWGTEHRRPAMTSYKSRRHYNTI